MYKIGNRYYSIDENSIYLEIEWSYKLQVAPDDSH